MDATSDRSSVALNLVSTCPWGPNALKRIFWGPRAGYEARLVVSSEGAEEAWKLLWLY